MSARLDSLLAAARLADCARNDENVFPLQAKSEGLRFYVVTFGSRKSPRQSYVVMAKSSAEAWDQNACLAEEGERMEVLPADSEPFPVQVVRHELECKELAAVAADVEYLRSQARRDAECVRIAHEQDLQHLRCIGGL